MDSCLIKCNKARNTCNSCKLVNKGYGIAHVLANGFKKINAVNKRKDKSKVRSKGKGKGRGGGRGSRRRRR